MTDPVDQVPPVNAVDRHRFPGQGDRVESPDFQQGRISDPGVFQVLPGLEDPTDGLVVLGQRNYQAPDCAVINGIASPYTFGGKKHPLFGRYRHDPNIIYSR